jgi:hypothetical protein
VCSDGLTDMLNAHEIEEVIEASERDPRRVADALVAAANERGGEDNITVVLFEMVEADAVVEQSEPPSGDGGLPRSVDGEAELRRHGAGSGGRLAAILFLLSLLAGGVLLLYWGIKR